MCERSQGVLGQRSRGVALSFEKFHLAIIGAHSLLGAEVARLAVALGHDVSGLDAYAAPPSWASHEPWVHGVTWRELSPERLPQGMDALAAIDRVVVCGMPSEESAYASERALLQVISWIFDAPVRDLVLVSSPEVLHAKGVRELVQARAPEDARVVFMTPAPVLWTPHVEVQGSARAFDEDAVPGEGVQRVELVAMAALRAVLEDAHRGELDCATIAVLGDAMMIQ